MRGAQGLSSVEILVALAVFAAGILPAVYGVAQSLRAARIGRVRTEVATALLSRAALLHAVLTADGNCSPEERLLVAEVTVSGKRVRDSVRLRLACP